MFVDKLKLSFGLAILILGGLLTPGQALAGACPDDRLESLLAALSAGHCKCAGKYDPASEEIVPWKHLGEYVGCVTRFLDELAKTKEISSACRGGIRRCVVKSTCGRPDRTRCCVPSHRGKRAHRIARKEREETSRRCRVMSPERCKTLGGIDQGPGSCCGGCAGIEDVQQEDPQQPGPASGSAPENAVTP